MNQGRTNPTRPMVNKKDKDGYLFCVFVDFSVNLTRKTAIVTSNPH